MNENCKKPVLLISESKDFCVSAKKMLEEVFLVRTADFRRDELLANLEDVNILWVRLRNLIDQAVIGAAPNLKAIATNTTGLNHIDLISARSKGIKVISLKGEYTFLSNIRATAEHSLALTLALLRKLPAAHNHVCQGGWDRYPFKGRELYKSTVGIIGYGRLGRIVARYFQSFGARVLVYDKYKNDDWPEVEKTDLEKLCNLSDIISLHIDYRPENKKVINQEFFEKLKSNVVLINTSRGELVDEAALLKAIEGRQIAGAALDVVDSEHNSSVSRSKLIKYANQNTNLILTPHIGGNTFESHYATERFLANKLLESYFN